MARKKETPGGKKNTAPNTHLRRAREYRNLTQTELAEAIGVTTVTISRWENGNSTPAPFYREKLSEFFQMNAQALGLISREEKSSLDTPVETSPVIWNAPYHQNPFFTGREKILTRLRDAFTAKRQGALTRPQALSGLGGVGKTQIAMEYAYRYRDEYRTVLWVRANSYEALISDFVAIAAVLNLPEQNASEQSRVITAVKRWLVQKTHWLLIFDSADNLHMVSDYIPTPCQGHVLLTTRSHVTGKVADFIETDKMSPDEAALLLLRRARLLPLDAPLNQLSKDNRSLAASICQNLDGLPLAINQAGAYIEETGSGLADYLQLYQTHRWKLLQWRETLATDYPYSVATTWSLSFEKIAQTNPAAAELLQIFAFLVPDAIPEEILIQGNPEFSSTLQTATTDAIQLNETIRSLLTFSLLRRSPDSKTLTIHRLVQAVLKDRMDENTQRYWAERTVRVVNRVFPEVEFSTWGLCQRYLPQAQVCANLIIQYQLAFPEAARLLDLTGFYLLQRGRFNEAEQFLQQARAMREEVSGSKHPDTAANLNNLAQLYQFLGKYELAESFCQRALAIREEVSGPEHPDTATSLNTLANLYDGREKFEQAEPLFQRALAIRENMPATEQASTALTLNDMAVHYANRGKFEQAEIFSQRALAIRETILSPEHPDLAVSLGNLAGIYHAQGKYDRAEALYQHTLTIFYQAMGPEYSDEAIVHDNLAWLYIDQGKYEQAEISCRRALKISEKALGDDHPNVSQSLMTLAWLYQLQEKYEQAELLYRRALAIREKTLGPQHSYTATSFSRLAILYTKQGLYEQAETFALRALEIREKALDPEHQSTASSYHDLAAIYQAQGKLEQAETFVLRAVKIREKTLGTKHPDTASSCNMLANIYVEESRYEEAEQLYRQALATREEALGSQHPDVAKSLHDYASLLQKLGRIDEASAMVARAKAIQSNQS